MLTGENNTMDLLPGLRREESSRQSGGEPVKCAWPSAADSRRVHDKPDGLGPTVSGQVFFSAVCSKLKPGQCACNNRTGQQNEDQIRFPPRTVPSRFVPHRKQVR